MSYPSSSVPGSGSSSGASQRGVSLASTVHSEVAPCLPLPSLPIFCGASDQDSLLFDLPRSLNRMEVLAQSSKIADLLQQADVSYLNLRDDAKDLPCGYVEPLQLHDEVLLHSQKAFDCITAGPIKEQIPSSVLPETKSFQPNVPVTSCAERDHSLAQTHQFNSISTNEISTLSSRKSKVKKTAGDELAASSAEVQDTAIGSFCVLLEDLCSRAEIPTEDQDESEWLSLPLSDIRKLVNEIMSMRAKKLLHLVSVDILVRLLKVLDHQIHRAEGLSIDECENSVSDVVSTILSALESIHAALAVMAHNQMPKQLYKEEVIERILDFTRRQIMDVMCASDPSFRAVHKPSESNTYEGDNYEDCDGDFSASKKRRVSKITKVKRTTVNRSSAAVNTIIQKLCTVLGLLKEFILIEKLSDSCILQLVKTSCTTFLVDNIQLLQLKAIGFLAGVFYSYVQHKTYIIDELLQLLWKLPSSKRALRAYHLPEEEQRQIQMITALLIQLVHSSANLPDTLRQSSTGSTILEVSVDANHPSKCHEAATEVCCLFWSRVLQRFTSVKTQDASELKSMMENLVMDLLTTLNLPEYPASAPILEVLCVLLLQNAGLKSKDISARCIAIDLLGTIASRLKRDAVACSSNKFWMLQDASQQSPSNDVCCVCLGGKLEKKHFICEGCQGVFHADCMGMQENHVSYSSSYCQMCLGRKQLIELRSHCKSQLKDSSFSDSESEHTDQVAKIEILQQLLLNYLQDVASTDDMHLFIRWFYVCLWYKDDPKSQLKLDYYIARLKTKTVMLESRRAFPVARDSIKKISLVLGQNSSFSRGFDKILHMLLASLRENSPVIRAKALKAVSIIVEADPEVLGDKRVQSAVEGRFCDSAISVREAALELVGRHIASHPDVGFKYFEKIAERVKDTGVSVRKRAIKLIRDMCTSNINFSGFARACVEIISRVSDDESSIQDLVCKTFYEFWFEEPSGSQSPFFGVGSSIPLEVAQKTEQIVDMSIRLPNHQLLVTVIKRNLSLEFLPQSAKAVGINPVLLTTVRKRCELMCKCLLEKILQIEEMNNDEVETKALPYVLVLHSFCVVDPTLCAPASDPSQFVVTLQPYLKSQVDSRAVAQLLESIIFIIDSVLPSLRKLAESVVEELEQDLKQMIVRHSFLTVVHACIKCICSVSRISGKGAGVIQYLIQIFFKRLDDYSIDNKQVGRSLFCLGLLIRYGNALLSSGNNIIDTRSSLTLFVKHLSIDDFVIKVRSLQALGFLLIARPEYMLEKDIGNILEAALSSESDVRLRMQALQNMFEYLLDAESQLETNNASDPADPSPVAAGQTVPVAAGSGEANICGGIVQLYWDNILDRCLDTNEQVRQLALKIVEVVLRQGLVHPITSVPYLIALETDPQEANSKLAHHLLMNMNEKYPAFFEIRLGDGLQTSFHFIQSISASYHNLNHKVQSKFSTGGKGKLEDGSFNHAKLGVSRIYKLIRSNRMSRNKFMTSIVRKFDNPNWNNSVIPFLIYCTEVLASLPFTSPDEPLYLIYAINRVVQVRAGSIEENMKALSSSLSHKEPQKMPDEYGIHKRDLVDEVILNQMPLMDMNRVNRQEPIAEEDLNHTTSIDLNGENQNQSGALFSDHRMSGDSSLRSSVPVHSCTLSKDDIQKIQPDCLAAIALQLLLKLKRYLKIVYSLNDERCQAYSPTEPPKVGEILSRQSVVFDIRETNFSLPTTTLELVQRFQEFKNALREDTIDYSIYTANIKRKRPAPKRSRRSGRMAGGDYDIDDDDDNEDGTWTGSARKVQYSGRRSSARATRHH